MHSLLDTRTISEPVVGEAEAVARATVRRTMVAALRGANACGCRSCCVHAVKTYTWAVEILGLSDDMGPDDEALEHRPTA